MHPENGRHFLRFLKSEKAQRIYSRYGFTPGVTAD